MRNRTIVAGLLTWIVAIHSAFAAPQWPAAPALPEGSEVLTNIPYVKDGHERQKRDVYVHKDRGDGSATVHEIESGRYHVESRLPWSTETPLE